MEENEDEMPRELSMEDTEALRNNLHASDVDTAADTSRLCATCGAPRQLKFARCCNACLNAAEPEGGVYANSHAASDESDDDSAVALLHRFYKSELEHLRAALKERNDRIESIIASMAADPDEAAQLHAIGVRLLATPEHALFEKFRSNYYAACGACKVSDEILRPTAAALRCIEQLQPGNTIDDIPWFTKTLTGLTTKTLIRQYRNYVTANGGKNYVEFSLAYDPDEADPEGVPERVTIIICSPEGKTPSALHFEAEAARDERPDISRTDAAQVSAAEPSASPTHTYAWVPRHVFQALLRHGGVIP